MELLDFEPGLVGGHCIGVDPFYLAHVALSAGYKPNIILSGRTTNEKMAEYIAKKFTSQILKFLKNKTLEKEF